MRRLCLWLATILPPTAASAADGTFTFQMAEVPGNPASCMRLSSAFDRPYTLTAAGNTATLTSGGGVHINMTSPAPDRYHGVFELSGERLDYTADMGATRTLSARGSDLGCRWTGKAQ